MLVVYHSKNVSELEKLKGVLQNVGAVDFLDECAIGSFQDLVLREKFEHIRVLCVLVGERTAFSKEIQNLIVLAKNLGCVLLGVFLNFFIIESAIYYENPFQGYWIETEEEDGVDYVLFSPKSLEEFDLRIYDFIQQAKKLEIDATGFPMTFDDLE